MDKSSIPQEIQKELDNIEVPSLLNKTEPTEIAIYAFDLTYYFLNNLYRFDDLPEDQGISCGFNFSQQKPNLFTNKHFYLLKYNDYQIESLH